MRHIFVDMSNLLGGARQCFDLRNLSLKDAHDIIDPNNLLNFFGRGKYGTHVVAGSDLLTADPEWLSAFKKTGFITKAYTLDQNFKKERVVDEFLCNQALRVQSEPTDTFVFVTGDGNDGNGYGSFYEAIKCLLQRKNHVEVWSFRCNLSKRYANELQGNFPKLFSVNILDGYAQYDSARRKLQLEVVLANKISLFAFEYRQINFAT